MRVSFFEVWNRSPHLETSLELAGQHLKAGDEVFYYFLGHDVPYREGLTFNARLARWLSKPPERRGGELLASPRFHFFPRVEISPVEWERPIRFDSLEVLKSVTFQGADLGLGVVSSLVHETKNSQPDLERHAGQVNRMLDSAARVYAFTRRKLEEDSPDRVYTFNGRFANYRAIMRAVQAAGVPLLLHERGADRYRYSVRPFMPHDREKIQQEMLEAWGETTDRQGAEEAAHAFFRARRNGREQGWRSFTGGQERGAMPELPAGKRLVTYFSSSDDEYVAVGDIYRWEHWSDQYRAVLDLIELCEEQSELLLVIRLHPHLMKKSVADRQRWLDLPRSDQVRIVAPDSDVDTYALVDASDVVVSAGSTVGIEAVYWGTPSINLGPSLYSELNATFQPAGREELRRLLTSTGLAVHPERAYPYGYYKASFGREFEEYEPNSLFAGRFRGIDLQRPSPLLRLALWARRRFGGSGA